MQRRGLGPGQGAEDDWVEHRVLGAAAGLAGLAIHNLCRASLPMAVSSFERHVRHCAPSAQTVNRLAAASRWGRWARLASATSPLSKLGYVKGVGAATPDEPRYNYTEDPYFTDGLRAALLITHELHALPELEAYQWEAPRTWRPDVAQ